MARKLKAKELSAEALQMIAARFKVLSDVTRLRLLIELEAGEKNVTELVRATDVIQANVSRHLQMLTDAGLVRRRKEGVKVYYAIADDMIFDLCEHVCGSLQKRLSQQGRAARLFVP